MPWKQEEFRVREFVLGNNKLLSPFHIPPFPNPLQQEHDRGIPLLPMSEPTWEDRLLLDHGCDRRGPGRSLRAKFLNYAIHRLGSTFVLCQNLAWISSCGNLQRR